MEEAFEKLKKEGKNDVDHLVKWMKDSKIIDQAKLTEEKARDLFKDAANKNNIELAKFKAVLTKIATDQNKSLEEFSKSLVANMTQHGEKVASAFGAAASAFAEAMKK